MNHINIALAANRRYLPGLLVTAGSLVRACSAPHRLVLHILSDDLREEDIGELHKVIGAMPKVKVHDLSHLENKLKQDLPAWHGSYAPYFRLFLVDLLTMEDWVVYTDVDIIWTRDIVKLWELRDPGLSIQWCLDTPNRQQIAKTMLSCIAPDVNYSKYCCSGMTILNLARWRSHKVLHRCIDLIRRHGHAMSSDQDILNIVLNDEQGILPQHWDILWGERDIAQGAAFHITGIGSFFNGPPVTNRPQYEIWFRTYRQLCPWRTKAVRKSALSLVYHLAGYFYGLHYLSSMIPYGEMRNTIERTWYYAWLLKTSAWNLHFRP